MSDFRHLERPRSRPEFFGLATLDTVTCALAGGIVLMILMAALTDRSAPVQLTPLRAIFESGEAKDPTPAERGVSEAAAAARDMYNLAVVFISAPSSRDAVALVSARGQDCALAEVEARIMREAGSHFLSDDPGASTALGIWAAGNPVGCQRFEVQSPVTSTAPCSVVLVTGGHYDVRRFPNCNVTFVFTTALTEQGDAVFRFERGY
ncbi:hypothetical protein [Cohaesibacter gelatinilyticus]|nr:hypothetical protein [Cohaesibacter gelatinilyticus]